MQTMRKAVKMRKKEKQATIHPSNETKIKCTHNITFGCQTAAIWCAKQHFRCLVMPNFASRSIISNFRIWLLKIMKTECSYLFYVIGLEWMY